MKDQYPGESLSTPDSSPASSSPALSLRPISSVVSLRDQAYAMLKQAIADADIYGSRELIRLDERLLSEQLGVSRTPVREAMTLLEQEGFLRTVPRRGIYIQRKTRREVVQMIQMWAALESMAARLAIQHATDAQISAVRHLFDSFLDSAPSEHLDEYSETNIAFHQAIFDLADSPVLSDTMHNIFAHVRSIRKATITQSDRAEKSIIEHMKIIEALEARDTERAERLVRDHSLDLAQFVESHCEFLD